jgi:hypothetical protein
MEVSELNVPYWTIAISRSLPLSCPKALSTFRTSISCYAEGRKGKTTTSISSQDQDRVPYLQK